MKYTVVKTLDPSSYVALRYLSEYVNNYIQSGWEPIGGVQILNHGYNFIAVQAMVKK